MVLSKKIRRPGIFTRPGGGSFCTYLFQNSYFIWFQYNNTAHFFTGIQICHFFFHLNLGFFLFVVQNEAVLSIVFLTASSQVSGISSFSLYGSFTPSFSRNTSAVFSENAAPK